MASTVPRVGEEVAGGLLRLRGYFPLALVPHLALWGDSDLRQLVEVRAVW